MALAQQDNLVEDNNLAALNTVMEFTNGADDTDYSNVDNINELAKASISLIDAVMSATGITMDQIENELSKELEGGINTITEEQNKVVIAPKTILVISTNKEEGEEGTTKLFEGLSSLTKSELKAQYGDDIIIYYQQLYTTVTGNQTYDEAIADEYNFKKLCYSREEFTEALDVEFPLLIYGYITYSHKDLRKQQRVNALAVSTPKVAKNKGEKVDTTTVQPNFSLFLFTSFTQVPDGVFPIKGLSDIQIETAKKVLELEDFYINEYVLKENDNDSIKQQQECILFIVGTPNANDSYIKMSNLRWITELESGENIKGLIKNNIDTQTGVQVYMLRLNVWDKRQSDVFIHCNYNPITTK